MTKQICLVKKQGRAKNRIASTQMKFSKIFICLSPYLKAASFVVGLSSIPGVWAGDCFENDTAFTLNCFMTETPADYSNGKDGLQVTINKKDPSSDKETPGFNAADQGLQLYGDNLTVTNKGNISNPSAGNGLIMGRERASSEKKSTQIFINEKNARIEINGSNEPNMPSNYYGVGVLIKNGTSDTTTFINHGVITALGSEVREKKGIIYLYQGNVYFTQSDTGKIYGMTYLRGTESLNFQNAGEMYGNIEGRASGVGTFINTGTINGNINFSEGNDAATMTMTNTGTITGIVNISVYKNKGEFIVKPPASQPTPPSVGRVISNLGKLTLQGDVADKVTYQINMNNYQNFSHLSVNQGQWFFSGASTFYTIDLNGGTLYLQDNKALNDAEMRITNGGMFQPKVDMTLNNNISADSTLTLSGDMLLTLGGKVEVAGGLIKNGESTVTLTGANTYKEKVTLNKGALILQDPAVLTTQGIVRGTGTEVSLALRGGILRAQENEPDFIAGFADQEIVIGNDTNHYLTIDSNGKDIGIQSNISGSGGIIKQGEGRLTLSGIDKYAGNVNIQAGELLMTTANPSCDFKNVLMGNGVLGIAFKEENGRFYFNETVGNAFTGKVAMNKGIFTLDQDAMAVLSSAALQLNTDSLMEIDANRKISALTLQGGTVRFLKNSDDDTFWLLSADTIDTAGGGTLAVDPPRHIFNRNLNFLSRPSLLDQNQETEYQLIAGTVNKGIGSQLTLADQQGNPLTDSYQKEIVQDGTIRAIATYNYTANVKEDGVWLGYGLTQINLQGGKTLTLSDDNATNNALSAQLTGTGNLVLNATKPIPFVLANVANDYTGSTTIKGGTVQLGTHHALGNTSQLTLLYGTAVDINGKTQTIGALDHQAGAILNLNGGNLTIAQGGNAQGVLQGKGNLFFNGGQFTLQSNSSAFMGSTAVAGALTVNGQLGGVVSIVSGGRLQGSGQIGTTTVASGATLAAGNSIGTFTVNGNLVLDPGAIFEAEIHPDGQSDLVKVTGSAKINGQLSVIRTRGRYSAGQRYLLLEAGQGVTGTFSSMTQNLPFIDLAINQDANHIYLDVTRNASDFDNLAPGNRQEEAGAIDGLGPGNPLYDAISQLPDEAAYRQALDMLSGEIYPSTQAYLLDDSRHLRDMTVSRMQQLPGSGGAELAPTTWVQAYGAWGNYTATAQTAKLNHHQSGVFMGTDSLDENDWRVGMIGGYGQTKLHANARNSQAKIDGYHLGLYSGIAVGSWNFRLGGAYSWYKVGTQRYPKIGLENYANTVKYGANNRQFFGELGYQIGGDTFKVEPFVNVAYVKVSSDAFKESGSITALAGENNKEGVLFSTLAIRASKSFAVNEAELALQGNLGWRHASEDTKPSTRLTFAGSKPFHTHGTAIAQDAALVGIGISLKTAKNVNVELNYAGLLTHSTQEHSAKMNMVWKF